MKARSVRIWSRVHTWTSLVCTLFLFVLCITGLPLIFRGEIDALLGDAIATPSLPPGTPAASLDRVVAAAEAQRPGDVPLFMLWDRDDPALLRVTLAPRVDAPAREYYTAIVDARTAVVLNEPSEGMTFTKFVFRLHADLFAGLPGKLFLGSMGLVFLAALGSGVVLYAPFMRRSPFGTVRRQRSRTRWLDLHNLLGITTLAWMTVVGATGVINAGSDLVIKLWQRDQLAEMISPYRGLPVPGRARSVEAAVATVRRDAPAMTPRFIAFPGTPYSSARHYAVFLNGSTPLTSRMLTPALVDAVTTELVAIRSLPWYGKALFISEPLHFGDYGGLPLRLIWALLDIATMIVLGSGVFLWLSRRRVRGGSSAIEVP